MVNASGASRLPSSAQPLFRHEVGRKRCPCAVRTSEPAVLAPVLASTLRRRPARARSPRVDEGPREPSDLGGLRQDQPEPRQPSTVGCVPRRGSRFAAGPSARAGAGLGSRVEPQACPAPTRRSRDQTQSPTLPRLFAPHRALLGPLPEQGCWGRSPHAGVVQPQVPVHCAWVTPRPSLPGFLMPVSHFIPNCLQLPASQVISPPHD